MPKLDYITFSSLEASYNAEKVEPDYGFVSTHTLRAIKELFPRHSSRYPIAFTQLKFMNASIFVSNDIPDNFILWASQTGKPERIHKVRCPSCTTLVPESQIHGLRGK